MPPKFQRCVVLIESLHEAHVDQLVPNLSKVGIKATGALDTAWVGYKEYVGDNAAAVTNAAHDRGVRVVPTFQLFDSGTLPKMTAFLHSGAAQARSASDEKSR
jgi:hypothetical protein